jgi:hypothetical protein
MGVLLIEEQLLELFKATALPLGKQTGPVIDECFPLRTGACQQGEQ